VIYQPFLRKDHNLMAICSRFILITFLTVVSGCATISPAPQTQIDEQGYIVVVPDRGYLGNQEIQEVFQGFSHKNQSKLVFINLYAENEKQVRHAINNAFENLARRGVANFTIIPFTISENDPHLNKFKNILKGISSKSMIDPTRVRYLPAMGKNHRIAKILLDRIKPHTQNAKNERLVVIGYGATTTEEEKNIRASLNQLIEEVQRYFPFKETQILIMYHRSVDEEIKTKKDKVFFSAFSNLNKENDLKTIVIPFHLGLKHTYLMQRNRSYAALAKDLPVEFISQDILPDPNILRWLNHSVNFSRQANQNNIGVIVMAHGSGFYYNEAIEKTIAPLKEKYPVELTFGMADTKLLSAAISKLEAKAKTHILIIRLFDTSQSFKTRTEFVLGLRKNPPRFSPGGIPMRVQNSPMFWTTGGLDADPLISEVLNQRVIEISTNPKNENVLLVAHGAGSDRRNQFWLDLLQKRAQYIHNKSIVPFKNVDAVTIREDWPEKRMKALLELRNRINTNQSKGEETLIISARIFGEGPYRKLLKGLSYKFNGKGIAPHKNLTRWLENQINDWEKELMIKKTNIE